MPAAIVDPTVQAQGSIPASPLGNMLSRIVGVYGQQFPTPLERSEMDYRNAETQKLHQELGAPGELQTIFQNAYAKPQANAAPLPAPSRDDLVSSNLPELAGTLARAGQYGNIGNIFRTFTANAPGITAVSNDPHKPSPVSMSMMGAGDAYTSTPDASQTGFTPGQRDRNSKIQSIIQNNPGVDPQRAANIVDGVLEYPQDPITKNIFEVNKATSGSSVLKQGNTQVTPGGAVSSAPGGATPSAGPNGNNPFNLRPAGATTGFQSFPTPEAGMVAGLNDLALKLSGQSKAMKGQQPTLRNIISTYSPPNENNTQALIANAAQRMNIDPDAPLNISHLQPLAMAVLAQEGNNGTANNAAAQPSATIAAPAAGGALLGLKRGDLGIPFGDIYGGGAAVNKASGALDAVMGGSEANSSTTNGLRQLNAIKNQLVAINNQRPGIRSNGTMQANYMKQFPDSDPQIHDLENGVAQGTTGPGTAEDTWLANLEDAARNRVEDSKMLTDPNASAEERQAAKMRVDNTDKLFAGLPQPVQQAYQQAVGIQQAPQTNLQRGSAATTVGAGKVRVMSPDGKQAGFIDAAELPQAVANGWKRAQ